VGQLRLAAAAQVDGGCGEQGQIDQGRRNEQRHAQAGASEHVPRDETGEEGQPEGDLGSDDERDEHDFHGACPRAAGQ
jgi:hypothetical protein